MDPIYFVRRPERDPDFLAARKQIRGKYLILVEGQDDLWFFDEILRLMEADPSLVQTLDYSGAGELPVYLDNLLKSDPILDGDVRGILITGDSDTYTGQLPYKIKSTLKAHGLPEVLDRQLTLLPDGNNFERLGLFLLPHASKPGNLETVLLATVDTGEPAIAARSFVETFHADRAPANDKRVTQAYLATRASLSRGAGWGARKGYFDLQSDALGDLKEALAAFIT